MYKSRDTDKKLNEKLKHIEENLNTINFDIDLNRNRENSISSTKNFYCSANDSEHQKFLLKLKIFEALKKYYINKIKNKEIKKKILEKEKISKIFYQNLLKSRSFYGLLKWIKLIKNFRLINHNYYQYKVDSMSKKFLNSLIYVYNRKNLSDAIFELREKKLKTKTLLILKNKLRYRINHNTLYFSQLSNNFYSVEFLLFICNKLKKNKNFQITTKKYFNSNFRKLNFLSELNDKKKIFYLFKQTTKILKEKKEIKFLTGKKFHQGLIKIYIQEFFKKLKEKFNFRKKKEKLITKLFLVRYYFKKYRKEISKNTITNQVSTIKEFKRKLYSNLFISILLGRGELNKNRKNLKNLSYKERLISKIFKKLKFHMILNRKKNYLKNIFIFKSKYKFFRILKLNSIEGLLIHGLYLKIQKYYKKNLLYILINSSVNKHKLSYNNKKRITQTKKLFLNSLQDSKIFKEKISNKFKKFYCGLFIKKVYLKQYLIFNHKKLVQMKLRRFKKMLFFLRVQSKLKIKFRLKKFKVNKKLKIFKNFLMLFKKKTNSSINKSKCSISESNQSILHSISKIFFHRIFFLKFFFSYKIKQKFLKIKKTLYFKKFSKKINIKITVSALKLFTRRINLINNSKLFLKNIFKLTDQKNKLIQLYKISKKFFMSQMINQFNLCTKNKKFSHQIGEYYSIKLRKKIFNNLKIFYINNLKHKMLSERYMDYIKLKFLNFLAENSNQKNLDGNKKKSI